MAVSQEDVRPVAQGFVAATPNLPSSPLLGEHSVQGNPMWSMPELPWEWQAAHKSRGLRTQSLLPLRGYNMLQALDLSLSSRGWGRKWHMGDSGTIHSSYVLTQCVTGTAWMPGEKYTVGTPYLWILQPQILLNVRWKHSGKEKLCMGHCRHFFLIIIL